MPAPPFAQSAKRASQAAVGATSVASNVYVKKLTAHSTAFARTASASSSVRSYSHSSSSSINSSDEYSRTSCSEPLLSSSDLGFHPSKSASFSTSTSLTSASVSGFSSSVSSQNSTSSKMYGSEAYYNVKPARQGLFRRLKWPANYSLPKYAFSNIPRPKRNFLYYNPVSTLTRGLSTLRQVRPTRPKSLSLRGIRFHFPARLRRYGGRREYSGSSQDGNAKKNGGKAKRAFLRFWAIPAISTVIIWTAIRNRTTRNKELKYDEDGNVIDQSGEEPVGKPAQPWKVAAYSTLPLKAMSRLWGRVNDIDLPVWMREPGYKLYSYLFGVNLDEVAEPDLTTYHNLGEFFYRELKPGVRPIDESAELVSPADGKVLHLGVINDGQIEQVKGITYSLDALLGSGDNTNHAAPCRQIDFEDLKRYSNNEILERHKEFAQLNGISYTVDELIGGDSGQGHASSSSASSKTPVKDQGDATIAGDEASLNTTTQVAKSLFSPPYTKPSSKELFFAVIYLAPGDYHRFHSPANWVAELRRHFVGELYSVAPYFQSRLSNLFVLNERVALLGKWKHGFFSMTPVGATNVGSIRIHFDKNLTTNTVYEDESISASRNSLESSSSEVSSVSNVSSSETRSKRQRVKKATCYEATYAQASPLLGGYPLLKGQQMGGFNLGSTVVLVFEAPKNFEFTVKKGEKVKVGQSLGILAQE